MNPYIRYIKSTFIQEIKLLDLNFYDPIKALPIRIIEGKIKYKFKNKILLKTAFIHSSFVDENSQIVAQLETKNNERLEFLGDSILGLIVSDYLYEHMPEQMEGELTEYRSSLVNGPKCASYIEKLNLESHLLRGTGSTMSGKTRIGLLGDLFEALLGAIYLDGGFQAAKRFFINNFKGEIYSTLRNPQKCPDYELVKEEGPDHSKTFYLSVWLGDEQLGIGKGLSKKEGEQQAAKDALKYLGCANNESYINYKQLIEAPFEEMVAKSCDLGEKFLQEEEDDEFSEDNWSIDGCKGFEVNNINYIPSPNKENNLMNCYSNMHQVQEFYGIKPQNNWNLTNNFQGNWKGALKEYCDKRALMAPIYSMKRRGPDHCPTFCSFVTIGNQLLGEGESSTKKQAEHNAARMAMKNIS